MVKHRARRLRTVRLGPRVRRRPDLKTTFSPEVVVSLAPPGPARPGPAPSYLPSKTLGARGGPQSAVRSVVTAVVMVAFLPSSPL